MGFNFLLYVFIASCFMIDKWRSTWKTVSQYCTCYTSFSLSTNHHKLMSWKTSMKWCIGISKGSLNPKNPKKLAIDKNCTTYFSSVFILFQPYCNNQRVIKSDDRSFKTLFKAPLAMWKNGKPHFNFPSVQILR